MVMVSFCLTVVVGAQPARVRIISKRIVLFIHISLFVISVEKVKCLKGAPPRLKIHFAKADGSSFLTLWRPAGQQTGAWLALYWRRLPGCSRLAPLPRDVRPS